jgi:hypothetical protein
MMLFFFGSQFPIQRTCNNVECKGQLVLLRETSFEFWSSFVCTWYLVLVLVPYIFCYVSTPVLARNFCRPTGLQETLLHPGFVFWYSKPGLRRQVSRKMQSIHTKMYLYHFPPFKSIICYVLGAISVCISRKGYFRQPAEFPGFAALF